MLEKKEYCKYLPVSSRDRNWGIYTLASGLNCIPPKSSYPILQFKGYSWQWNTGRTLDDFQILLLLSGKGVFESKASGHTSIRAGDIVLLFPGMWHRYKPHQTTGWIEQWIIFNGSIPLTLMENGIISPKQPVLRTGPNEYIVELFREIADLVKNETAGYQQIASMSILEILAQADVGTRLGAMKGSKAERKIREACAAMAENMSGTINMHELAQSMNLGYSWFRRVFKNYTGHSPAQYHLNLRMNRAKHLLLKTEMSIKEIAYELGFDTPSHFSSVFKKIAGHSPTLFRVKASGLAHNSKKKPGI